MTWMVEPGGETPYAMWHCTACQSGQMVNITAGLDALAQARANARAHVIHHGHMVVEQHGNGQMLMPLATEPPEQQAALDNLRAKLSDVTPLSAAEEDDWDEITRRMQ